MPSEASSSFPLNGRPASLTKGGGSNTVTRWQAEKLDLREAARMRPQEVRREFMLLEDVQL